MFSTQSDNCIPICPIFDILSLFSAEMEKPKIGISGKGLEMIICYSTISTSVNPLPDDNSLDWSKLKQIADGILWCI